MRMMSLTFSVVANLFADTLKSHHMVRHSRLQQGNVRFSNDCTLVGRIPKDPRFVLNILRSGKVIHYHQGESEEQLCLIGIGIEFPINLINEQFLLAFGSDSIHSTNSELVVR